MKNYRKRFLISFVIIIAFLLLISGAFFYYNNTIKAVTNLPESNNINIASITNSNKYINNKIGFSFFYPNDYIVVEDELSKETTDEKMLLNLSIYKPNRNTKDFTRGISLSVIQQKFGKGGDAYAPALLSQIRGKIELYAISNNQNDLGDDNVSLIIKKIGNYDWVEHILKQWFVDTYTGNSYTYYYEKNFVRYIINSNEIPDTALIEILSSISIK